MGVERDKQTDNAGNDNGSMNNQNIILIIIVGQREQNTINSGDYILPETQNEAHSDQFKAHL